MVTGVGHGGDGRKYVAIFNNGTEKNVSADIFGRNDLHAQVGYGVFCESKNSVCFPFYGSKTAELIDVSAALKTKTLKQRVRCSVVQNGDIAFAGAAEHFAGEV